MIRTRTTRGQPKLHRAGFEREDDSNEQQHNIAAKDGKRQTKRSNMTYFVWGPSQVTISFRACTDRQRGQRFLAPTEFFVSPVEERGVALAARCVKDTPVWPLCTLSRPITGFLFSMIYSPTYVCSRTVHFVEPPACSTHAFQLLSCTKYFPPRPKGASGCNCVGPRADLHRFRNCQLKNMFLEQIFIASEIIN